MILVRRHAPDGAHTEQTVSGAITIGRATDNSIQLPGLLVALHHLRLTPATSLTLQLDCLSTVDVVINGLVGQRSAVLAPGDELQVGGHRIRVSISEGGGLMLEVRERDPDKAGAGDDATTTLAAAGWRLRRPAVIGAVLVLLVCLVVPLILRAVSAPTAVGADTARRISGTTRQTSKTSTAPMTAGRRRRQPAAASVVVASSPAPALSGSRSRTSSIRPPPSLIDTRMRWPPT